MIIKPTYQKNAKIYIWALSLPEQQVIDVIGLNETQPGDVITAGDGYPILYVIARYNDDVNYPWLFTIDNYGTVLDARSSSGMRIYRLLHRAA